MPHVTITHDLLAEHAGSQALCLAADERIIGSTYALSEKRPARYLRHALGKRPRTVMLARLDREDGDGPDSDEDPDSSEDDYGTAAATVAIVAVEGPLEERATRRDPCGAWTMGYDTIAESFAAACAAPAVDAILMRFRSPGGAVNGVFSCAARLEAAKAASGKAVVGIVDENCESAAYLLAAAVCDVIMIPEAGFAGSIGARGGRYNNSARLAAKGVSYQAWGWPPKAEGDDVSGKLAGHPDMPVSALGDARGAAGIADAGEMFGALVERTRGNRGLGMAAILALKADSLRGPAAVAAHLADRIGTREDALALALDYAANRRALLAAPAPPMLPAPVPAPAMPAARVITGKDTSAMSLVRLATLAGLAADAPAQAIEAALTPLVTLSRAALAAAGTNDPETARGRVSAALADAAEVPALRKSVVDLKARAELSDRVVMLDAAVMADRLTPAQAWDFATQKDAAGAEALGPDGKAIVVRTPRARWLAPSTNARGEEIGCTLGNLRAELESRATGASGGRAATPFEPDAEKAKKAADAARTAGPTLDADRALAEALGRDPAAIAKSRNALLAADGSMKV